MATPLYTTDIIPLTSRPTLTVMDDGDYFVILDTSTGKISKILKTNIMTALKITYDNTSGLTAANVQAALDELVVNLGSSDSAILALSGRLDTLEGTGEGSVAKAIGDLAGAGRTTETVKGNADAIALRELLSNKKTTLADNSDTFYPTQKAVKTVTDDHETRIQVLENTNPLESWADIQTAVRSGVVSKYLSVGDQLVATYNGVEKFWDIIGIDHDTPTDTDYTHSLTIQSRDLLRNGRISGPEAMYNAVTELLAGTYIFTTYGLQYTFTSTQAVPVGGVIYIKTRSEYVPLTLTIYGANRTSIIEDDIAVTTTSGTDNLTPINEHVRMRYGNNNYPISASRQWLNSESATFTWQPLGLYDMPSSYETAGFINLLDADLQAVIGAVDKQVALATYDGGGQELFSDKVFLLSRVEMGLGTEGVTTGESVYDFWSGASNADRLKGSPRNWWLRSPSVSFTHHTNIVNPSGELNYDRALTSHGLAPACVIY
jgi:hypothetical protein